MVARRGPLTLLPAGTTTSKPPTHDRVLTSDVAAAAPEAADAALAARVTPELLTDVVALVPDAWLVPGPEAPADLRSAYAGLLHRRVEARAAWLPGLLAAAAEAAAHPPQRAGDPLARLRRAREGQA